MVLLKLVFYDLIVAKNIKVVIKHKKMTSDSLSIYDEILCYPAPASGLHRSASYLTWSKEDRMYHVVHGLHFSLQAMELIKNNIEAHLEDPQQWVFLVEGCDATIRFGFECDEVSYATLLAIRSGIPYRDPVIDPSQPEVIKIVKSQGVDERLIYAAQIHALEGTVQIFYDETASYFSEKYGISLEKFAEFYKTVRSANKQKRKELNRIYDRLSKASTNLSRKKLRLSLQEYQQPNVFLYFGNAHLPMIDFIRK
ncbi:MAG: hypothetical protein AABX82_04465 [Nanoarchaeota archaeon]